MNRRETLCDYFDEDVVIKWSPNGKLLFGLVVESSENASDSEEEDSDDESDGHKCGHNWRRLRPGFAKIAFYPNGNTRVLNESKVKLYDRSLLNGDVVQRLDPKSNKLVPNSEHGFCKSTRILATIKILGTNKVIQNVDSNDLEMLCTVTEDTICLLDSWLGYVKEVTQKLTLKCMDGSLLIVSDLDVSEFEDLLTQREDNDSEFNRDDYYIGQQLYGPKKYLKNAKWVSKTKQMKHFMSSSRDSKINVVVEDITIDSVSINWLSCLSDETHSKNMSQNCETISNLFNKSRKQSQDMPSLVGSHPMGNIIRGKAIDRIKCLNHFGKCSLQLGHQSYYTIKPNDSVLTISQWIANESLRISEETKSEDIIESEFENSSQSDDDSAVQLNQSLSSLDISSKQSKNVKKSKRFCLHLEKVKEKKLYSSRRRSAYNLPIKTTAGNRLPVEIVATNTRVNVVWQSSSEEEDVPSIYLYPVHHIDNHDFFPGDYVIDNKEIRQTFDYGVVDSCDAICRTAKVKWFSVTPDSQTPQFVSTEELSVYDIKDHPDFSFRSGVCVVKILAKNEDICDPFSRVGQVIDLTSDGRLNCFWLNGQTSLVWPQQLFIVGDYDSDDLWDESDSEIDYSDYSFGSDKSWKSDDIEDIKTKKSVNNSSKSTSGNKQQNQCITDLLQSGILQLEEWVKNGSISRQNVLNVLKKAENSLEEKKGSENQSSNRLTDKIRELSHKLRPILSYSLTAQTLNNSNGSESDPLCCSPQNSSTSLSESDPSVKFLEDLKIETLVNETQLQSTNGETVDQNSENVLKLNSNEEKEVSEANHSTQINGCLTEAKGSVLFLESVPECHKYLNSLIEPKNPKEFLKRNRFEITLLKNALPEGIDVVLFEDRIDLMSVLITGPKGTPYEDGLFIFDIQLPSNYPNVPPIVHYISFCSDRLNPNLYESGKVCVSLLGTWTGKGTEVWAPNTSNILQVIISIQGLILVAEPYYNEAGYGKQKGTTTANENSRLYNEMVVIKMIQSMTKMAITPPITFKAQIQRKIVGMADKFIERHKNWLKISEICISKSITSIEELYERKELLNGFVLPPFPLLPASHGFCLSLSKAILVFEETLKTFV